LSPADHTYIYVILMRYRSEFRLQAAASLGQQTACRRNAKRLRHSIEPVLRAPEAMSERGAAAVGVQPFEIVGSGRQMLDEPRLARFAVAIFPEPDRGIGS
jgi:hypothetical protein